MQIPIYSAEKDIADQVAKASVVFSSKIEEVTDKDQLDKMVSLAKTLANVDNVSNFEDLISFKSILCSVGTNKNYDHLLAEEVWPARNTPINKQINYEHDERDIIGHMSHSLGMDVDGNVLGDTLAIDELPSKFHIVDYGFLYNSWAAADLRQRMVDIVAAIKRGEMFVSMEALFKNFDYLLIDERTNSTELVKRNGETAFLTKYLRIYGGDGVYKDKKVARVLRYITFCGKGLVKRPANPESVIISMDAPYGHTKLMNTLSSGTTLGTKSVDLVWGPANTWIEQKNGEQRTMSANDIKLDADLLAKVEALTKALDQAQKEKVEAQAKAEADAKLTAKNELDDLRNTVEAKDAELKTANDKINSLTEAAKASEVKVTELEAANKTLAGEMEAIKVAQKTSARVGKLVEAGKERADAEKLVATFEALDDTAFDEFVSVITAAMKDMKDKKHGEPDDDEDCAQANASVNDLDDATVVTDVKGNADAAKEPEYKGLAAMFAGQLKSTASFKDVDKLFE